MYNSAANSNILPPTSLRDIISLIFILNALPRSISCIILITYILSGSSKFIGGKLILKYVTSRNKYDDESLYYLNNRNVNYKSKLFESFLQILAINSLILLFLYYSLPFQTLNYLSIFSKSILASELIGSSSNSTFTSIISTDSNLSTKTTTIKKNGQGVTSNHHKHITTNDNSNGDLSSVSERDLGGGSFDYKMLFLKNTFLKVLFCFFVVLFMDFVVNTWLVNLNLELIVRFIKSKDYQSIFSSKILKSENFNFGYNYDYDYGYEYNTYFNWSPLFKHRYKLLKYSKFLNYIYFELCIHVITLKCNPIWSIIGLKNYSNNLDHLTNLTPTIPIAFKRNNLLVNKLKPEENKLLTNNEHDSYSDNLSNDVNNEKLPIISLRDSDSNNDLSAHRAQMDLININVNKSVSHSTSVVDNIKPTSITNKNFEVFCITPFTKLNNYSFTSFSNTLKAKFMDGGFNDVMNKPPPKGSTTIIDKNFNSVALMQPFWSLLAACKTIIKDPNFFAGKSTKIKNNGSKFIVDFESKNSSYSKALFSIKLITDTRVILKALTQFNHKNIKININGLNWDHYEIIHDNDNNQFIKIYSLSPYFQYEIEIFQGDEVLNTFAVNTVSSTMNGVLNQSPRISPIMTLQSSLISTIEVLNQVKSNLKKYKREENKKQSDLKKDYESLVKKIAKVETSIDNQMKKLENLKQINYQYENEIKEIKQKLDIDQTNNDYENIKMNLASEINSLKLFIEDNDEKLNKFKKHLKLVTDERNSILGRSDRLLNKKELNNREIDKIMNDIENLKRTGFLLKIFKRIRKLNENFDSIIPKVKHATNELNTQFAALANTSQNQ